MSYATCDHKYDNLKELKSKVYQVVSNTPKQAITESFSRITDQEMLIGEITVQMFNLHLLRQHA